MVARAPVAPDHVRSISPYVPGKPIDDIARELHLDPKTIIKLASNENPRGPSKHAVAAIAAAAAEITRYPDGNGFALKAQLSRKLGIDPAQIVLGNGSNDILELATQAFLRPGEAAIYAQHAFAVYPLATQARGGVGIEVPARDYGHDLDAMRAAVTRDTRIVFIANPNNPTGSWISAQPLEAFIAAVPPQVLIVLDEAYYEYLRRSDRAPSLAWVGRYPNLLVTRTFSKAYGLAALRVGYGVMSLEVADMLNRVRQPFNVNALAQVAAIAALADTEYVEQSRDLNDAGLTQIYQGLAHLHIAYLPSRANFVMAHVGDASRIYQSLLAQGVIVRPVANYGLPDWLRISVGLPEENERFLEALETALAAAPSVHLVARAC